jgi:hypothetical protein
MMTNLMVLPSLLLSLDKYITTRSFKEPYFEAYDEHEDAENEWDDLSIESNIEPEDKNNEITK